MEASSARLRHVFVLVFYILVRSFLSSALIVAAGPTTKLLRNFFRSNFVVLLWVAGALAVPKRPGNRNHTLISLSRRTVILT